MLNGNKSWTKPRNYVIDAMIRAGKKSVIHGKTKKAERRRANQNVMREAESY